MTGAAPASLRPGTARAAACTVFALLLLPVARPAAAEANPNITRPSAEIERELAEQPLRIVAAAISRPKAKGDITLRVEASFADRPPYAVKLRRAEPGADEFNNCPRYDSAAYELQKLYLDPDEYVVPPTVLRMLPLEQLQPLSPAAVPTFPRSDDVLVVLQYWLQDVTLVEDAYDPARFARDRVYARHIGQLNILTYLIEHRDSNLGNFLISTAERGSRVFSVDNGVAFEAEESDRGELWKDLRVRELPADAIERLRRLDKAALHSRLAVLAQWELRDGHYVRVPPGGNLAPHSGVRTRGRVVQMGLTAHEILTLSFRLERLLQEVNHGHIRTF